MEAEERLRAAGCSDAALTALRQERDMLEAAASAAKRRPVGARLDAAKVQLAKAQKRADAAAAAVTEAQQRLAEAEDNVAKSRTEVAALEREVADSAAGVTADGAAHRQATVALSTLLQEVDRRLADITCAADARAVAAGLKAEVGKLAASIGISPSCAAAAAMRKRAASLGHKRAASADAHDRADGPTGRRSRSREPLARRGRARCASGPPAKGARMQQ